MIYSQAYLVDAHCSKCKYYKVDDTNRRALANAYYEKVGKDKFRVATALDAAAMKEYKVTGYCNL